MYINEMATFENDWFYLQGQLIAQLEVAAGNRITDESRGLRGEVRERIIDCATFERGQAMADFKAGQTKGAVLAGSEVGL